MPTGFPDYYGGLTLPVTVLEGGTGQTSIDAHALLIGNLTSSLTMLAPGTSGYVLQAQGSSADPIWAAIDVAATAITGILAIAHGGTGTATPGLVAGTGIGITGSWPDQTITNSSAYASLADPLPIAHGGTGATAAGLTAGANIDITGTWPSSTIALASSIAIAGATITPTAGLVAVTLVHDETTHIAAAVEFYDGGSSAARGYLGAVQGTGDFVTGSAAGDIFLRSEAGSIWLSASSNWAVQVASDRTTILYACIAETLLATESDTTSRLVIRNASGTDHWYVGENPSAGAQNQFYIYNQVTATYAFIISTANVVSLANALPVASGGTGATTFDTAGLLYRENYSLQKDLSSSQANVVSYTPSAQGIYRVTVFYRGYGGSAGMSVVGTLGFTENGHAFSIAAGGGSVGAGSYLTFTEQYTIIADASVAITLSTTFTQSGSGALYDIAAVIEHLEG